MTFDALPTFYDDLPASYEEAWTMLTRAKVDRRSAFHTPTIATVDAQGCPQLRTVVLRGADKSAALLRFHTDRRARKVAEIAAQPCVSMHFYDKKSKIQLRVTGVATAHMDGPLKEDAWAGSRDMSRECYRINKAPGTRLDDANDWAIPQNPEDPDLGKENFVAVGIQVQSIEWLYLARGGHRRALFQIGEGGALKASTWLVP